MVPLHGAPSLYSQTCEQRPVVGSRSSGCCRQAGLKLPLFTVIAVISEVVSTRLHKSLFHVHHLQ